MVYFSRQYTFKYINDTLYIMHIYVIILKEFCAQYTYGALIYDRTHDIQGIY